MEMQVVALAGAQTASALWSNIDGGRSYGDGVVAVGGRGSRENGDREIRVWII